MVGLREADFRNKPRHAFFDGLRADRRRAPAGKRLLEGRALGQRETDQQHARATELAAGPRPLRPLLQLELHPKRAAQAERALQPDAAAHQPDKVLGDRRAQARPAEAPGGGLVGLREALEDLALRLGRDADPRVPDRELEARRRVGLREHRHMDGDAAFLGKLDGVADEIDQHLA
jgi:hypothetical protein